MITIEQHRIGHFLKVAKDEHTKLHGNDPNHDWISFYAEIIYNGILQDIQSDAAGKIGLQAYKRQITIHDFSSPETAQDTVAKLVDQ